MTNGITIYLTYPEAVGALVALAVVYGLFYAVDKRRQARFDDEYTERIATGTIERFLDEFERHTLHCPGEQAEIYAELRAAREAPTAKLAAEHLNVLEQRLSTNLAPYRRAGYALLPDPAREAGSFAEVEGLECRRCGTVITLGGSVPKAAIENPAADVSEVMHPTAYGT